MKKSNTITEAFKTVSNIESDIDYVAYYPSYDMDKKDDINFRLKALKALKAIRDLEAFLSNQKDKV